MRGVSPRCAPAFAERGLFLGVATDVLVGEGEGVIFLCRETTEAALLVRSESVSDPFVFFGTSREGHAHHKGAVR